MTRPNLSLTLAGILLCSIAVFRLLGGDPPIDLERLAGADALEWTILLQMRGPRVFLAICVGAALGLAGSVLQVVLRNPLASPDIIGFSAGSAAGAVAFILVFGSVSAAMAGAYIGGAVTLVFLFAFAWRRGLSQTSVILIGVALSLVLTAATDVMLSLSPPLTAGETALFLSGSFAAADWNAVALILPIGLAGAILFLNFSAAIGSLELGDEVAVGHGLDPTRIRVWLTGSAALLVASATAVAGPIPFVAFLAGPIARLASGRTGPVLALSAMTGAVLATGAEALSTIRFLDVGLPAGIFTAALGGPVMLMLVLRSARMSK